MAVTLNEITAATVRDVIKLAVAPDQQQFVAPNGTSLAEALFSNEAWYRAVHRDGVLVGFVMLYDESMRPDPPTNPNIGLWRLMIDQRYQRQGIGREVIRLIVEHARAKKCFSTLSTSYVPGPGSPGDFYLSLGFVPNGEVDGGEIVAILSLGNNASPFGMEEKT
jgi:diamine N-acetyltransferase